MCCAEEPVVHCIISMVIRRQTTLLMAKLNYACEYSVATIVLLQEGGLNSLKGPSKCNIYDSVSGGFQATNKEGQHQ